MTALWADTVPAALNKPLGTRLSEDVTADVVIVGGGYTGLWTAYHLQMQAPDLRVTIVEAEQAGFGASGRNGGWCSALFPASLPKIARKYGVAAAQAMQSTMHDTVAAIHTTIKREGWQVDAAAGGTVMAARTPVQLQRAEEEITIWRRFGFGAEDYRLLTAVETTDRLAATDVLGGLYTPHCMAIHPAKLIRELATTVVARGVTLYEDSPAVSLTAGIVRTDHGSVQAPIVVRATEGYTATIPGHHRDLVPVYSLMLATEPLSAATWDQIGLAERETFTDLRNLVIYGQRTADDRIAFGGRGAPYHFGSSIKPEFDQNSLVFQQLWATLIDLFPVIVNREVTHTWGGPLGVPRDWFASCGLDRTTGLAWSGGYVGDGVGTSYLGGATLADLILDQSTERTGLAWVNHRSRRWEPEPLRWIGTNLGLRTMTAADTAEDRTAKPSTRARLFSRLLGG